ncbi:hypothetical protein [Aestuariibaculum suncheonense]|uniref:Uncharacterized protein n=1 Tax=Aestuariibaculum suncheonense TaxID=1028745 RepID=A0A8J6UI78_9FLAO|nr:hypothetical protein [Aestuariibaculum suncheonense]MBD0833896.1 hypothetical protein [Aestuariibaculum suncheonense]
MKPYLLFLLPLILLSTKCDDDPVLSQDDDLNALTALKAKIETLASASECNETTTCKYIAFGSKPCGGPWGYLIYSTSIDVEILEEQVKTYNQMEADYNKKWGIFSDCMLVSPPKEVRCENNTCVAVY